MIVVLIVALLFFSVVAFAGMMLQFLVPNGEHTMTTTSAAKHLAAFWATVRIVVMILAAIALATMPTT